MVALKTIPVRRLPDFNGVAKNASEFLDMDNECRSGEITVKYGLIESNYGDVECVAAICADEGIHGIAYYIKVPQSGWKWTLGGTLDKLHDAAKQLISEIEGTNQ